MGCFGEKIEEYEVLEHLGKGGFAHVYRGKCLRSGIFVAIKMIDKGLMSSAGMVGRVRQEVTIHSRLKHPAILELYTFFEDAHYVYLVLELAHNGELAKHFRIGMSGLSERSAADLFRQVVSGVFYLHSHNILHRDLSLNNLLLTRDMKVKIADFGLATQLSEPDEKHVTMCGTPNYISPEVASRNFHSLPADVWGLGCMLYTLLVGKPPFDTQHVKSTLNRVIKGDYQIPAGLSIEARDILQKLLCREPSQRINLQGILEHPFVTNFAAIDSSNPTKSDVSRDSGFHTTGYSTQLRSRSQERSSASAAAELFSANTHNSMNNMTQNPQRRPASFNVLAGILGDTNHSPQNPISDNTMYSFGQNTELPVTSTQHMVPRSQIGSDTVLNLPKYENSAVSVLSVHSETPDYYGECPLANATIDPALDIPKLQIDNRSNIIRNATELKDTVRNDHNKENMSKTSIGVPPLCADRLTPICHRTRNATLSIKSDSVVIQFIKKRGKDREERVTEVCQISKDGMKIIVFLVDGGKGRPLSSTENELQINHNPTLDEIFTYHNLPPKHWKKYLYASRFVDLVKAKTPKITLYSALAKCHLMENGSDFEAVFYKGGKVNFNSTDGLKIIDELGKTHKNPTVLTNHLKLLQEHFQECQNRCRRIDSVLSSLHEECFPLIIGRRPQTPQGILNEEAVPASYNVTPSINMGSFCHGTAATATSTGGSVANKLSRQDSGGAGGWPGTGHAIAAAQLGCAEPLDTHFRQLLNRRPLQNKWTDNT